MQDRKIIILFTIITLVLELVELQAIHKYLRPRKFYRPKHQWRTIPRSQKYRFIKGPPKQRTKWHTRYAGYRSPDEQPYTIEIELPKGHEDMDDYDYSKKSSKRFHQGYLNHEDNEETRVINFGRKKVRIKLIKDVRPKLRIKISRNDDFPEFIDKMNSQKNNESHKNNSFETNQLPKYPNYEAQFTEDLRGL